MCTRRTPACIATIHPFPPNSFFNHLSPPALSRMNGKIKKSEKKEKKVRKEKKIKRERSGKGEKRRERQ